jgi:hypothetical protein
LQIQLPGYRPAREDAVGARRGWPRREGTLSRTVPHSDGARRQGT